MAPPGIKVSVVVICLHRCWCGILGLRGRYREGGEFSTLATWMLDADNVSFHTNHDEG
jgi:hypothetical protein